MNSDKTEFMCYYQDGAIFSLNGNPLKLGDQFPSVTISYLLKVMSTYALVKHGLLMTG